MARTTAAPTSPTKGVAERLFLDFWEAPEDDPRRRGEGIDHAQTVGPGGMRIQIILLDTRSFRSPLRAANQPVPGKGPYRPDPDPARTMPGAAQWAGLRAQLLQPAERRLIVSSVQVLAEGHGWESWGNLPLERTKLFDLIAETEAAGVILISGDVTSALCPGAARACPTRCTRLPRPAST